MQIYMQTQPSTEQPLRFYHLHLQADLLGGWTLVRESGLQGLRGQYKRQYFTEREAAERALERLRDMQLKRGYRIVYREGIMEHS